MSNAFVIIKMCYVHNQWYEISCATLYIADTAVRSMSNYFSGDSGCDSNPHSKISFLIAWANINFSIWVLHFIYSSAATLVLTMKADISDEECLTSACIHFLFIWNSTELCMTESFKRGYIHSHETHSPEFRYPFLSVPDVLAKCC